MLGGGPCGTLPDPRAVRSWGTASGRSRPEIALRRVEKRPASSLLGVKPARLPARCPGRRGKDPRGSVPGDPDRPLETRVGVRCGVAILETFNGRAPERALGAPLVRKAHEVRRRRAVASGRGGAAQTGRVEAEQCRSVRRRTRRLRADPTHATRQSNDQADRRCRERSVPSWVHATNERECPRAQADRPPSAMVSGGARRSDQGQGTGHRIARIAQPSDVHQRRLIERGRLALVTPYPRSSKRVGPRRPLPAVGITEPGKLERGIGPHDRGVRNGSATPI